MDTIWLENGAGEIFRLTDYGLLLVSFDAPKPKPKTYRIAVDGADGDLDMTEWAGVVRYNSRTVTAVVRDMTSLYADKLADFCAGRVVKIYHSADPARYYLGRCECSDKTRTHVTDMTITATCDPYKLCEMETVIASAITASGTVSLLAQRRPVSPSVTVSAAMAIAFDNTTVSFTAAGTYTVPTLVITDTPKTVTVTGSGNISFAWRDGVL